MENLPSSAEAENQPGLVSDVLAAAEASAETSLPTPVAEDVEANPAAAPEALESEASDVEQAENDGEEADAESATPATGKVKPMHPRDVLNILLDRYPAAFFPDPRKVKPLAVGVLQELRAACEGEDALPLKTQDLRRALRYYTQRAAYLRAVVRGEMRINLLGEAVAEVTEEQKQHAQVMLTELEPKLPARPERAKPAQAAKPDGAADGDQAEGEAARGARKPRREMPRRDKGPAQDRAQAKAGADAGRRPARAPRGNASAPVPVAQVENKKAEPEAQAQAVEAGSDKLSQLLAKFARN
ncbi:MAG: ProQ/FINO family protein [Pseudomonadota bacterium]